MYRFEDTHGVLFIHHLIPAIAPDRPPLPLPFPTRIHTHTTTRRDVFETYAPKLQGEQKSYIGKRIICPYSTKGRIKLAPSLITLALSLVLFVFVINAGGGDKDQKNESAKKPEAHLDLAVC